MGYESFSKTTSLTITSIIFWFNTWRDLPNLKTFDINNGSFSKTRNLDLSSKYYMYIYILDLPTLEAVTTGFGSFLNTTSLTLSSIIDTCIINRSS